MSYTKFTSLVKDLDKKGKEISFNVNEVNDLEGRKESVKLQMISNNYQYLFFFLISIIMILFLIRLLTTSDTGIIDNIILIIVLLLVIHYLYYKFKNYEISTKIKGQLLNIKYEIMN